MKAFYRHGKKFEYEKSSYPTSSTIEFNFWMIEGKQYEDKYYIGCSCSFNEMLATVDYLKNKDCL